MSYFFTSSIASYVERNSIQMSEQLVIAAPWIAHVLRRNTMEQSHGGHKLLASVPIRELEINALDAQYVEPVRTYLARKLGCSLTYLVDGRYLILFPPGTVEETWAGRSTCWTRGTVIRLASGPWFRKLVPARSQFKPPAHAAKSSSTTSVQKSSLKIPMQKTVQKAHAKSSCKKAIEGRFSGSCPDLSRSPCFTRIMPYAGPAGGCRGRCVGLAGCSYSPPRN